LTAHVMPQDRDNCLEAGMNDYVTKPISPDLLLETLQKWLPASSAGEIGSAQAAGPELLAGAPGLDSAAGMRRSLGKWPLYSDLLRRFIVSHRDAARRIGDRLNAGDLVGAALAAHGLKSLAGHLGAMEIAGLTAELEDGIRSGSPAEELSALATGLETTLAGLIEELERRLITTDADAGMDEQATRQRLDRLTALLASADAEAVEFVDEHRAFLRGFLAQNYWAFEQCVNAYDFDGGLDVLRRHEASARNARPD
jgi:two-component system, sensor histidine kinase and response regulator